MAAAITASSTIREGGAHASTSHGTPMKGAANSFLEKEALCVLNYTANTLLSLRVGYFDHHRGCGFWSP